MTLLRTDTLHTWHYCAHTHCTHDIITHMKKKSHFYFAHKILLSTYRLHIWLYCAQTHSTHDFIAHIRIAHMKKKIVCLLCTQNIIVYI